MAAAGLQVRPTAFKLRGWDASQQLVVSVSAGERVVDRTAEARYYSLDPAIVAVTPEGVVTPVTQGTGRIRIRLPGQVTDVLASVSRMGGERTFSFVNDIEPILSRAGCNGGACHGKASGQHGFKLSVFAYDPAHDYRAIVRDAGGRRVAPGHPESSLILRKPTAQLTHGGGLRLRPDSLEARRLAGWIAAGAPFGDSSEPTLKSIRVYPAARSLAPNSQQQLLVSARYSDGSQRDITALAHYSSNDNLVASVTPEGQVKTGAVPGQAAVMVSYQGKMAVSRIRAPRPEPVENYPTLAESNYIDPLVWRQLRQLRIVPSEPATDSEFLRRAYLDSIGVLPTPEEARAFLADPRPDRRARLVDALLARPEYADYWALKWSDLLRVNKDKLGAKGAHAFYRWIRASLAANRPYDEFVREIVTASGNSVQNGPVNLYRVLGSPRELASSLSQTFLGVRIECAQCHHHPFEKWSQDDFYGMSAYFTRLKQKNLGSRGVALFPGGTGEAVNPRTRQTIVPHPLGGPNSDLAEVSDRRQPLAEWMTAPENPYFAKMIANRLWAHFLGRGLVEPVDDLRDTNPPSNPALLAALAKDFTSHQYDLKQLIRSIMNSRAYQLSSRPNETNAEDRVNYSRAYPKRMMAEVLMDAIASATGAPAELNGLPPGTRAVQIWDSEWSSQWQSYFLNIFGRPPRTSPCECERSQ